MVVIKAVLVDVFKDEAQDFIELILPPTDSVPARSNLLVIFKKIDSV
eukprot:SAG11_NODE_56_length_19295_cov_20.219675_17_plen_47_part_00